MDIMQSYKFEYDREKAKEIVRQTLNQFKHVITLEKCIKATPHEDEAVEKFTKK